MDIQITQAMRDYINAQAICDYWHDELQSCPAYHGEANCNNCDCILETDVMSSNGEWGDLAWQAADDLYKQVVASVGYSLKR